MQAIDRNELQATLKSNPEVVLIEVLGEDEYRDYHLPYSVNIPLNSDFEANVTAVVPNKEKPVVVYCKNTQCSASEQAGKKIEELGYAEVYDYEAGKEDWKAAGFPVASKEDAH